MSSQNHALAKEPFIVQDRLMDLNGTEYEKFIGRVFRLHIATKL